MKMKTAYQNLQEAVKTAPRGKFIALKAYIKNERRSKINPLSFHLRQLEKRRANLIQSKQKKINN